VIRSRTVALAGASLLALAATAEAASLMVSANDGKLAMVDGTYKVLDQPQPDTLTVIDASAFPPEVASQIELQHSVTGPPTAVAMSPDEKIALVGTPNKVDEKDKTKLVVEKFLQVVDLEANPPKVVEKVALPHQPIGVSFNKAGTLALAAHFEGEVSVLSVSGKKVEVVETLKLGDEKSRLSTPIFTPDGKTALVTKRGEDTVAVLAVDGKKVTYTKRDITVGNNPYAMDVTSDGKLAAVANIGRGTGDADSVTLIDLSKQPFRAIDVFPVGQTPEGIGFSPDGQLLAVNCIDGSNKPKDSPFRADAGKVMLFAIDKGKAQKLGEAPTGHNAQGAVFTPDGKHVLVQNYVEKEIAIYRVTGVGIEKTEARIEVPGFPASLRRAP
jgi:DNA-binding beta-propeller fold protein YncE